MNKLRLISKRLDTKGSSIFIIAFILLLPAYFFAGPKHASLLNEGATNLSHPQRTIIPQKFLFSNRFILSNSKLLYTRTKKDSLSKFSKFNKKAERAFVYIPVPLYSYSSDAGQTFGLAKFNLFEIYKNDTITKPSKISGVFTMSTKGRINFSLATELPFKNNDFIILAFINYKVTPEYIFGIGNDVKREDIEQISTSRFKTVATALFRVYKAFYVGAGLDIESYFDVKTDSTSFLVKNNVYGVNGGNDLGIGVAGAYDTRDNRYNSMKGSYVLFTSALYSKSFGSAYDYARYELDARKFVTPWYKHTIAFQVTTTYATGEVPFYNLALMGGENQMRGYYKGALRDKILVDGQIEYRMPIWKVFGVTGWIGTGRVADEYKNLSADGFWLSYGGGLRIKVDSKHNTNLRMDFGFGPGGINAFYINFAEAF